MSMTTAAAMVAAAKQRIENLTVEQVVEELNGGAALLIDVREPDERLQHGVIPGAIYTPRAA
ncbi:MAG: rhodanese-like domain-containing protein [Dehalococcoidia bacterium]